MADIINTPGGNRGGAGGIIAIILAVVLIIMLVLLFFPGLFDRGGEQTDTETQVEDTNDGNIVIPPPTVNNTTINSTSTFNLGTTTDEE
jgi:hypothetical protein